MRVQGEFTTEAEARRAAEAIEAAGIPRTAIHLHDLGRHISPDTQDRRECLVETEGEGVYGGVGTVYTGIMVVGDGCRPDGGPRDLPPPSGMRVLVNTGTEVPATSADVVALMRAYHAANIRESGPEGS